MVRLSRRRVAFLPPRAPHAPAVAGVADHLNHDIQITAAPARRPVEIATPLPTKTTRAAKATPATSSNSPAAKPKRRRKLPIWLTPAEFETLLATVPTPRDRLLVLIGAYAGLRVSELCHLRIEHIDIDAGVLRVIAGKGNKDRNLPLHPLLAAALRAWVEGSAAGHLYPEMLRAGWLFPSTQVTGAPLSTRTVQRMVKAAAAQAGITKPITPHKLRHSYASWLREKGTDLLDIRDLLGHSSVATTQIYAHSSVGRLRGVIERL